MQLKSFKVTIISKQNYTEVMQVSSKLYHGVQKCWKTKIVQNTTVSGIHIHCTYNTTTKKKGARMKLGTIDQHFPHWQEI